jgi:hypothetical protein
MSYVTNVIFVTRACEDEEKVTAFLREIFREMGQKPPVNCIRANGPHHGGTNDWYGGSKRLETDIYIGAYNGLDLGSFVEAIPKFSWDSPEDVQLLIKTEDDVAFSIAYGEMRLNRNHPNYGRSSYGEGDTHNEDTQA